MMSTLHKHVAIAAAVFLAAGPAVADTGPKSCSAATLSGAYVFSASGWSGVTGTWLPKAIVEYIRFNGDGTLTVLAATVANVAGNGAVVQVPPGGAGSYVLDADCSGTLAFVNGPSFDIVASPKGDEAWMIQVNANNVLQGTVRRSMR